MSLVARAILLGAILLALVPGAHAAGDEGGSIDEQRHGGWQFEVTPYLWIPETHGSIGVRGLSADVDIGFDDVFDLLGDGELFAMMGHFEAHHGRLALFTDALGVVVDVEADGKIVRDRVDADAEADFDLASIELGAAYRILERERFTFEMLAGARYTHAHTGIDLDLSAEIGERDGEKDSSHDFVDPFIGGRGAVPLVEGLSLVVRGDVGGFGAGSELAWVILGGMRWELPWRTDTAQFSFFGGYKVYDIDYETGAGGGKEKVDVQMRGPALGITIAF